MLKSNYNKIELWLTKFYLYSVINLDLKTIIF